MEDFTLRQLRLSLLRDGHEVGVLRLREKERVRLPVEVDQLLQSWKPDRIVWCDIKGLPYGELWTGSRWSSVPKFALWFDEPVTPVERYGLQDQMKALAASPNLHHGIWDGYWRDEAKKLWGIKPHPIHLAADPLEYQPPGASSSRSPIQKEGVIFIGMLHSPAVIQQRIALFSPLMRELYRPIEDQFRRGMEWNIPCSHDLIRESVAGQGAKQKIFLQTECARNPESFGSLRWVVWAMCKNAIRINLLKQALEIAPLRVFCETLQMSHASVDEWARMLGVGNLNGRLEIHDVSRYKAEEIAGLYQEGHLHLQATDPQSVRGGIPYRVFQTAASGQALLTDLKPELGDCFKVGDEILGYESQQDFTRKLTLALKDVDQCRAMGMAARKRFEAEHTWSHRRAQMEAWLKG